MFINYVIYSLNINLLTPFWYFHVVPCLYTAQNMIMIKDIIYLASLTEDDFLLRFSNKMSVFRACKMLVEIANR